MRAVFILSLTILGGATVNYHMFSSQSRVLFHRAISQSGNLMNIWSDPLRKGVAKMRAIKVADKMNCPTSDGSSKEMIECLRKAPADKIVETVYSLFVNFINKCLLNLKVRNIFLGMG